MINDKRIIRSRQLLRDSFLGLLSERRYEDISVQDIIERAGVARSTFYAHYIDKEDLLVGPRGVFAREVKSPTEPGKKGGKWNRPIPSICFWNNILSHRETFQLIAKDSAMEVTMRDLYKKLCAIMNANIEWDPSAPGAIPSSLVVDHLAGSIITLVKWWVRQGMTCPPEQMDEMFQRMSLPVIPSNRLQHS